MIRPTRTAALIAVTLALPSAVLACTNHFDELFTADAPVRVPDAAPTGDAGGEAGPTDGGVEAATPCVRTPEMLASFLLPPSTGVRHHVDPQGNDLGPGTREQPWKTVQKAFDALAPGESAFVHPGIYLDPVSCTRSGTATAPMTIEGDPRTPAIFTDTFQIRGQFVRVSGLVFDGTKRAGTVYPLVAVRAPDVEISRNEFRFAKGVALEGFEEDGAPKGTAARGRVFANWFHDGAQSVAWHAGTGTTIAGNLFHDHETAIALDATASGTLIVSNTIARGKNGITATMFASPAGAKTSVIDNIVTGHGVGVSSGAGAANGNAEVRRNLFFGNTTDVSGGIAQSDNIEKTDPLFVSARDLHLQARSPAVGVADVAFTPLTDRDGRCRPIDQPDLGAFEQ